MDMAYFTPFFHLNTYLYSYNSLTSDTDFEFQVDQKGTFEIDWTSETYFD